jgi:hypothetical protein
MEISPIIQSASHMSPEQKKRREKAAKALANARQRCTNPKNKDYKNYGAVGIKVLLSVDELIAAIGLPPLKTSLDRVDPHGHYEVGNVRWASTAVQAANKKSSPAGSIIPLATLIAQQKQVLNEERCRQKIAKAWELLIKAFNRGKLGEHDISRLAELLDLNNSPHETFGSREKIIAGVPRIIFKLPSLTSPKGIVEARGPLKFASDDECAKRFMHHGLIFGFRDLESSANLPGLVRNEIIELLESGDRPGMTMVGRPSDDDLTTGWFEVWMLALASRLPLFGVNTALYPALTCIELLKEFGGPHNWDEIRHPLLDARLLFIPDFQLDCGPWGYLEPFRFGMLERLLQCRIDLGYKTVLGVQAPHKLTKPLKKILLGQFNVHSVANGVAPPILQCSLPTPMPNTDVGQLVAEKCCVIGS